LVTHLGGDGADGSRAVPTPAEPGDDVFKNRWKRAAARR